MSTLNSAFTYVKCGEKNLLNYMRLLTRGTYILTRLYSISCVCYDVCNIHLYIHSLCQTSPDAMYIPKALSKMENTGFKPMKAEYSQKLVEKLSKCWSCASTNW